MTVNVSDAAVRVNDLYGLPSVQERVANWGGIGVSRPVRVEQPQPGYRSSMSRTDT